MSPADKGSTTETSENFAEQLERATRGLLTVNVSALAATEKRIGLTPLRALQSLERLGPCQVTTLGHDLDVLSSTASRLADKLATLGYITREVSPNNRRATLLELTDSGRSVLNDLVRLRVEVFGDIVAQMTATDRDALIKGARAFTAIQQQMHH